MKSQVKTYTSKDKVWENEGGFPIPLNRVNKFERKQEAIAAKFHKNASKLHADLEAFKLEIAETCAELHAEFMKSKDLDGKNKGNWTWYNFNRSIKIEVSVQEQISFDDIHIQAAKEKLDSFFSGKISSEDEMIKEMALSAFETRSGRLDTKKVMSLLRWKGRVKSELFTEAMSLIEESIRRPESKTYFRISERMEDGSYQVIDLNFSSI